MRIGRTLPMSGNTSSKFKCVGCGRQYGHPPLKVRCEKCGCAFCMDDNCTGTIGGKDLALNRPGRRPNATCNKCGKGVLIKI